MNTEHPAVMAARMHAARHSSNRNLLSREALVWSAACSKSTTFLKTPFRFSAELSIEDRGAYKSPARSIVEIIKNRNLEKVGSIPLSKNSKTL
jgi:hypothetical protein